jgi:hypothetical protein
VEGGTVQRLVPEVGVDAFKKDPPLRRGHIAARDRDRATGSAIATGGNGGATWGAGDIIA